MSNRDLRTHGRCVLNAIYREDGMFYCGCLEGATHWSTKCEEAALFARDIDAMHAVHLLKEFAGLKQKVAVIADPLWIDIPDNVDFAGVGG